MRKWIRLIWALGVVFAAAAPASAQMSSVSVEELQRLFDGKAASLRGPVKEYFETADARIYKTENGGAYREYNGRAGNGMMLWHPAIYPGAFVIWGQVLNEYERGGRWLTYGFPRGDIGAVGPLGECAKQKGSSSYAFFDARMTRPKPGNTRIPFDYYYFCVLSLGDVTIIGATTSPFN